MIEFTVLGNAAPAGSKRALPNKHTGRIMVVDANKRAKPWQALVAAAGHDAMNGQALLAGPLKVIFRFYQPRPRIHYRTGRHADRLRDSAPVFPTTRPDLLKLARGCEDALTGVCWRDDSLIVQEVLEKLYGEPARCHVQILPLSFEDIRRTAA